VIGPVDGVLTHPISGGSLASPPRTVRPVTLRT